MAHIYPSVKRIDITYLTEKDIDGYTNIRNNKLFTYPYNMIAVWNSETEENTLTFYKGRKLAGGVYQADTPYLKEHMESSNFSEVDFGETCEVLIESRYETDKYYKIYEENKLINSDNIEEIIKYTPDDNIELKALLLRFRNNMPKQNIWNVFDI